MPEDGTRPTADRPGLGRRFLFRLAVHYEDVFSLFFDFVEALLLFIAFLIIDSIVALQTGFLITANVGNLAFAAVIVILFQRLLGLTTINEVDYAVYLAHRASDQSEEESTAWAGERPPTVEFHLHMKAMRRVGNWVSGGHVDDILRLGLPDLWKEAIEEGDKKEETQTFWEIAGAIELELAERAAKLPAGKRREPFAAYTANLEKAFVKEGFSFTRWQEFLKSQYDAISGAARNLARTHTPRRLIRRLQTWQIITAIAGPVLAAGLVPVVQWIIAHWLPP